VTDLHTLRAEVFYFSLVILRQDKSALVAAQQKETCESTGSLCVVGLGQHGSAAHRTAQAALQGADVIIGYDGFFSG